MSTKARTRSSPSASASVHWLTYWLAETPPAGAGRRSWAIARATETGISRLLDLDRDLVAVVDMERLPERLRGDQLDHVLVVAPIRPDQVTGPAVDAAAVTGRPPEGAAAGRKAVDPDPVPVAKPVDPEELLRVDADIEGPGKRSVGQSLLELHDVSRLAQVVPALAETGGDLPQEPEPRRSLKDASVGVKLLPQYLDSGRGERESLLSGSEGPRDQPLLGELHEVPVGRLLTHVELFTDLSGGNPDRGPVGASMG